MARYRRRPVVIDAVQFTGDNFDEIASLGADWETYEAEFADFILIETVAGDLRADVGDWVVKDSSGELYPCKPDVFAETYEPA